MMRETDDGAMNFEGVVAEELGAPLEEYGFALQKTSGPYMGGLVRFSRKREGRDEEIWVSRRFYRAGDNVNSDDVDKAPENPHLGKRWLSRHYLSVGFVTDGSTRLQTDGTLFQRGNDWWRFEDEAHLHSLLRNEILPLIRDPGLQCFHEAPVGAPGRDQVNAVLHENVA